MSTTEKTELEAVVDAVLRKRPVDPAVAKKIHDDSAQVREKFDTEVSLEALRSIRNDE